MTQIGERALVAWPLLVAETLMFGTAAFALLLAPDTQCEEMANALTPLWRGLGLMAVVFSPCVLLVGTANMGDVSLRAAIPFLPQVLRETHFGHVWSWSFPLTMALAIMPWTRGRGQLKTAMLGCVACALLLLVSFSSHAIDRGTSAVIVYFIHEVAAALWVGAILGLWFGAARGKLGSDWVVKAAPRVSGVAGWTVTILILSGLYTAYYSLGADPHRLVDAAYGRTLVYKVCAAMLVLLIGAYNRYWLMPTVSEASAQESLLRNVGVESVLLVGVLGLAALLANTPPAH
ncbi:MAG TPA: CopD family protein [Candidatus Binataceae bacterium]|nr:CopD family protein [Candidatus Binataceae bacterium]